MAFSSKKLFYSDPSFIPAIADEVVEQFRLEGFSVAQFPLGSGGADVSITKGGVFKAVLGMKTALKITLKPVGQHILAEAGVGIFGQQAIPTMISVFVFWPVILTQIWGMIVQSRLDNRAMELIENSINRLKSSAGTIRAYGSFCPSCGSPTTGRFCASCGKKLD